MTELTIKRSSRSEDLGARLRGIDLSVVAAWLLGFGVVFYLAMEGGGYDILVRNQVGIAIWWIAVVGVLVGALPIRRPNRLVLVAFGLLAGFVLWTALSLFWTESQERSASELSRVLIYLGVFGLAILIRGTRGTRHMVAAVGTAIALIGLIALTSRLQPNLIPGAGPPAEFIVGALSRLSYPINYWNGLAELLAVGLPLVLYVAISSRSIFTRVIAAGVLPALILTIYFTFSRSGTGAAIAGVLIFLAFTSDRVKAFPALVITGIGGAVLILSASTMEALGDGLTGPVAQSQGDDLMLQILAVCVIAAALHGGINWVLTERRRPRWLSPTRRESQILVGGGLIAVLLVFVAIGGPGQLSDGVKDFKSTTAPGDESSRLSSSSGNGRYQYWSSAVDQLESEPIGGTGSGTFEYWWARNGDIPGFIRDTHSLYFQTAGELGVVGILLLLGFVGIVLGGGAYRTIHTPKERRGQIAAALAGCAAFCLAAGFDWTWQLAAIPVAFLLLAAVLLNGENSDHEPDSGLRWYGRVAVALLGLVALVAIAIPLASTTEVRKSQDEADSGNLSAALASARTAIDIQPGAATPYLQEALVLELQGDLARAAVAAQTATDKEPTNWRTWIVLSRIEAQRGRVDVSTDTYLEAKRLNPRASIFQ